MYESGIIANLLKVKPEGSFIAVIILGVEGGYSFHISDIHVSSIDLEGGVTLPALLALTDFFKTSFMELTEAGLIKEGAPIGLAIVDHNLDNAKLLTGKATEVFAGEKANLKFSIATDREMWYNFAGQASGFVDQNDAEGVIEQI